MEVQRSVAARFDPTPHSLNGSAAHPGAAWVFDRIELLAGVWDVPVASLAHAIKQAQKGNYGPLITFVLPRLVMGAAALPRFAAYRAGLAAEDMIERGATETTIQRTFPTNTGERTTVTLRKYQLRQEGRDNIVYHVFVDDRYLLRWNATEGVSVAEFEQALWQYITLLVR